MVCPNCLVQMFQLDRIGGGVANEYQYKTWEVNVCPDCERKVIERYETIVISDKEVEKLRQQSDL